MAEASRKKSKAQALAEEGAFLAAYTQKSWFVKIKPAFGIDKAVFSFVKKGESSTHFDVYMEADLLDIWFDDLKNYVVERTLLQEQAAGEKYPKGYKYVTGENGEKSVGFVASQTAGCITVNGKDGNMYANVPVPIRDLKAAAKRYQTAYKARSEELARTTVEASTKWRDQHQDQVPEEYHEPEAVQSQPQAGPQPQVGPQAPAAGEIYIQNGRVTAAPQDVNNPNLRLFMGTSAQTNKTMFLYQKDLRTPDLSEGNPFSVVGTERGDYFIVSAFI